MSKRHAHAANKLLPLLVPRTGFFSLGLSFSMLLVIAMTAGAIFYVVGRIGTPPGGW